MAALGPCYCARAPSSCDERGPPFAAVRGPPTVVASPAAEHGLQVRGPSSRGSQAPERRRTGLVAPRHAGSPQTRDRTCVTCTGGWILNHFATREVPELSFFFFLMFIMTLFIIAPNCKQPKCPSTGKWINKLNIYIQWNTTQQWKGVNYWYTVQHGSHSFMKEAIQMYILCDSIYRKF